MNWRKAGSVLAIVFVSIFVVSQAPSQQEKSSPNSQAANAQQSSQEKEAPAAGKGDPVKGQTIFQANCAVCHDPNSDKVLFGPGLKGMLKPAHKHADGTEHTHTIQEISHLIHDGGKSMPPFKGILSDDEIADVLAYLQTL